MLIATAFLEVKKPDMKGYIPQETFFFFFCNFINGKTMKNSKLIAKPKYFEKIKSII